MINAVIASIKMDGGTQSREGHPQDSERRRVMTDSLLDTITTGKIPRTRRVMLYGVHGIGKSTWASKAPSPIFINLEDGLADIDAASFPVVKEFDDVMAQLATLYGGGHDYKTVVVDSADWLEKLIWKDVCTQGGKESIADFGFGKGYEHARARWQRFLDAMTALRNNKNLHTVLLAHAQIIKFENPGMDAYDRYEPALHKKAAALVQEWSDETLFANYRVSVRKGEEKFGQARSLAVGSGERVVHTYEQPGFLAKNRLSLPGELPLDWDKYAEHFNTKDDE